MIQSTFFEKMILTLRIKQRQAVTQDKNHIIYPLQVGSGEKSTGSGRLKITGTGSSPLEKKIHSLQLEQYSENVTQRRQFSL